jgi:hypothetical protein
VIIIDARDERVCEMEFAAGAVDSVVMSLMLVRGAASLMLELAYSLCASV